MRNIDSTRSNVNRRQSVTVNACLLSQSKHTRLSRSQYQHGNAVIRRFNELANDAEAAVLPNDHRRALVFLAQSLRALATLLSLISAESNILITNELGGANRRQRFLSFLLVSPREGGRR